MSNAALSAAPRLEAFLDSGEDRAWIVFDASGGAALEAYVRRTTVAIGDALEEAVVIATVELAGAPRARMRANGRAMAGTGAFRAFMTAAEAAVRARGGRLLYAENVCNADVAAALGRYGFVPAPGRRASLFKRLDVTGSGR